MQGTCEPEWKQKFTFDSMNKEEVPLKFIRTFTLRRIVFYFIVYVVCFHLCSHLLYFIVFYCIILYCIIFYCIIAYCIILYCILYIDMHVVCKLYFFWLSTLTYPPTLTPPVSNNHQSLKLLWANIICPCAVFSSVYCCLS